VAVEQRGRDQDLATSRGTSFAPVADVVGARALSGEVSGVVAAAHAVTCRDRAMDRAELEDMYRRYGACVLRRARQLLRDDAAARDALHDVFLKAWHAGDTFRRDASPVTWLYHITTNHCLNQLRDGNRRRELLRDNAEAASPPMPVDDRVFAIELLDQVPEELRAIAVYYFVDQMNHDEIASIVGTSRRTVGNRLDELRRLFGLMVVERAG
jgi:RNA polymerase sigma-70 factor (ECF subfamily)